jgi:hypothetical protein
VRQVGFEAGTLTLYLIDGLSEAGFEMVSVRNCAAQDLADETAIAS